MPRTHQPGETVFRSILPEDVDWKPFPAFPPSARLAVFVSRRSGASTSDAGPFQSRVDRLADPFD